MGVNVLSTRHITDGEIGYNAMHIWDAATGHVVASDKVDMSGRLKAQESSIWSLDIDPNHNYHIVSHTMRRGQEGYYLLRIFSLEPISVEQMPTLLVTGAHGDWHRSHDTDSTGGPLRFHVDGKLRENSKWCQNPQYHVELQDLFSKEEVKMKIVVRRTDKGAHGMHHRVVPNAAHISGAATDPAARDANKNDVMVGVTVCRATCLEDSVLKNKMKKQPRLSAVGEVRHFLTIDPTLLTSSLRSSHQRRPC